MPPRLTPAQIAQRARAYGLDPDAVLRVASAEGLSGGIGDGGHAYGPFQLNNAGGVITGTHPGRNSQAIQNWAWSPAGVDFALQRIAQVAKGRKGADAVRQIVTQFERPADPQGEIARALAGGGAGAGPSPAPAAASPVAAALTKATAAPPPDPRRQLLKMLAGVQGNDYTAFYRQLGQTRRQQQPQPAAVPPPAQPQMAGNGYTGPPGQLLGATQGEAPQFLKALAALAGYRKQPIQIHSGYRSTAKQTQLWNNRASNPNPVARPGTSLHERGLAADGTIGGIPIGTLPDALLARFGLARVPGDPVHVQILR